MVIYSREKVARLMLLCKYHTDFLRSEMHTVGCTGGRHVPSSRYRCAVDCEKDL